MSLQLALATTTDDPRNPMAWSGTPYCLSSALDKLPDVRTELLGPLDPGLRLIEAARKIGTKLRGERFLWEREPRIQRRYARQFADRLRAVAPDMVLSLGTVAAAALPPGTPYVVYVDTTFALNVNYYPTMTGVCARSMHLGEHLDRKAFSGARHVIVTSAWAGASVIQDYGVPAERVSVVPIGARHTCKRSTDELEAYARTRLRGPLRLLWIGVEWERKGGDVAVAIAAELDRRGIATELHIAGLTPSDEVKNLPYVRAHGFLDSRTHGAQLEELFLFSFALLLPSRAENTSVVIADAASFALPTFASDTGGMRTMVHDGINGQILPGAASAADYADALLRYHAAPADYVRLAASSRQRFESELSWDVASREIARILRGAIASPAAERAAA